MNAAILEHVNITVPDPDSYAKKLSTMFSWDIRWAGPSMNNGYTVHVGGEDSYVALYGSKHPIPKPVALNHIAVSVEDLEATEAKIIAAGYKPHNHGGYEPGRRFYFHDENGLEYEVVSYATQKQITKKQIIKQLSIMARFGALMK